MEDVTSRFMNLLKQTLIPDYCSDSARGMNPSGFRPNHTPLSEIDMADFLRGWDAQLLPRIGKGQYSSPRGGAVEYFFWEGRKAIAPRPFFLWIEPIITLAVLARMHFDFGWPEELIANQSEDFAFDVVGFKSKTERSLVVACEVKKSRNELDALIRHMQAFGRQASPPSEQLKKPEENAFNKVKALRKLKPNIFWAVGPNRHEKVFSVQYREGDVVEFEEATTQKVAFAGMSAE